jgi:RHS repeat-associated protein
MAPGVNTTWTYDALEHLTEEQYVSSLAGNSYTGQYAFDLVGNRLSKTTTNSAGTEVVSYAYNANDELVHETGTLNGSNEYQTQYGYDANGSEITMVRTGSGAETAAFTYDIQHRLASAIIDRTESGQSVSVSTGYSYNNDRIRGESRVTTSAGTGAPTTTTTQYLNDANNPTGYSQVLEEHVNGSTAPIVSYILGLSVVSQSTASGSGILMPDGQGSTRLITNISGTVVARYAYDVFGNLLGVQAGLLTPPLTAVLFAGQLFDVQLQQYNLRSREYDSLSGRFTQRDAFSGDPGRPSTFNKYVYAHGDPANFIDPSGRLEFSLCGMLISFSIKAYFYSVVASYVIGKGLRANYLLTFEHNLDQLELLEWSDLLAFVPGAFFGKVLKTPLSLLTRVLGKNLAPTFLGKLSHELPDLVSGFRGLFNGAWVIRIPGGRTLTVTSTAFKHFLESHVAEYYDGTRPNIRTLWPGGTSGADVLRYIGEAGQKLGAGLVEGAWNEVALDNGLTVRLFVDAGGIVTSIHPLANEALGAFSVARLLGL